MLETNFTAILSVFAKHEADFIVVGGVSALLNGAGISTFDVDLVHSRQRDNLQRVLAALRELDGWYRLRTDKKLVPKESHLRTPGHQLLTTVHGNLDLLGAIGDSQSLSYEDLLAFSTMIDVGSFRVRTLNLDKYVELKEKLSRDKDRAALPTLRAVLAEKKRLRK